MSLLGRLSPPASQLTIPTRFIELSADFIEYLKDDGPLYLPDTENTTNMEYREAESSDSDSDWDDACASAAAATAATAAKKPRSTGSECNGEVSDVGKPTGMDTVDSGDDSSEPGEVELPSFPKLEARIAKFIEKLGGSAFPKLNWSAPRDAVWVTLNNSLK
jgi:hypothetical protein